MKFIHFLILQVWDQQFHWDWARSYHLHPGERLQHVSFSLSMSEIIQISHGDNVAEPITTKQQPGELSVVHLLQEQQEKKHLRLPFCRRDICSHVRFRRMFHVQDSGVRKTHQEFMLWNSGDTRASYG